MCKRIYGRNTMLMLDGIYSQCKNKTKTKNKNRYICLSLQAAYDKNHTKVQSHDWTRNNEFFQNVNPIFEIIDFKNCLHIKISQTLIFQIVTLIFDT